MNTLILFIHVVLAIITVGFSARVIFGKDNIRSMWTSFAGVVVSGGILTLFTPHVFGKVCLMTAGYIILLSATHLFYTRHTKKLFQE
jgi:tryptophan-rich sensory protein